MNTKNVIWKKKISENQQFRSTWIVEVDGVEYIAKRIVSDNKTKLESLAKSLKKQVRFSEILNKEEQKQICLYETSFEEDNYIAFLRHFCKGISLADKLSQDKRFSINDTVSTILSISRIVQIAHEHNVFHGDLKPSNIIVGDDKEMTIIDWDTMSISSCVNDELLGSDVTVEQTAGTPAYMPLEQFQGARLTQQSDVYSLGVILYQLLAGETPFDNIGVKSPTQIAIYKQNHEPESILVKHPELGIPEDLGKLIEDSLKNDLNQRLQNVGEFIQRLETIGKISASKESTYNTPAQNIPAPSPSTSTKKKGKEHKLVLIGHTGAGKTVLAAGLYATQDKDFGVDDPGSKTQTGIHAINTKTIIEEGHWPAATSVGDITKLRFKINHKGKEEEITFDEYAGERMEMEDYENKILKTPDGAFVLINPGGKQWHNTRSKNSLISDLKHYIDLLSKKANNPPIAFVITASDRLESDLKDFASTFQTYVDEIENYLIRKKCVYKVFHVSVSGVLKDQNHPHLAPKGIKDPFIWLLKQFSLRESMRLAKKISIVLAALVALVLLTLGGLWINDYSTVSSVRKELASIQTEYNTKMKNMKDADNALIEYRNNLVSLLNKNCQQNHFEKIKAIKKCDQKCYPFICYSSNKVKFDNNLKEVMAALDEVNFIYYSKELEKTLNKPTEESVKDVAEIEKWEPLLQEGISSRVSLLNKYKSELPLAIENYEFSLLEEELRAFISTPKSSLPQDLLNKMRAFVNRNPIEANVKTLHAELTKQTIELEKDARIAAERTFYTEIYSKLNNITTALPNDIQDSLNAWNSLATNLSTSERQEKNNAIDAAYRSALKRVFDYSVNEKRQNIRKINVSTSDASSIGNVAKDYMAFRNMPVDGLDPSVTQKAFDDMGNELLQVINNFINDQQAKARKVLQTRSTYQTPSYGEEIRNKILVHFPIDIRNQMNNRINDCLKSDNDFWLSEQKKIVDSFISKVRYMSANNALDELKSFCMDNPNNPSLGDAESTVITIVYNELDAKVRSFDGTKASFDSINDMCAKIKTTKSNRLKQDRLFRFADNYVQMMSKRHTVTITDIQVSSSYRDGAYIENLYYSVGGGNKYMMIGDLSHDEERAAVFKSWKKLPNFNSITIDCEPWERLTFYVDVWENIDSNWVFNLDDRAWSGSFWFNPGNRSHKTGSDETTLDEVTVRVYYELNYNTLNDLLSEAFK